MSCKKTLNHIVGCGFNGPVTAYMYLESGHKHPGIIFNYCPNCGKRLFIEDVADKYKETLVKCWICNNCNPPPETEITVECETPNGKDCPPKQVMVHYGCYMDIES